MKVHKLTRLILLLSLFLTASAYGQTPTPRESKTMKQMFDEALEQVRKDSKPAAKDTKSEQPSQTATLETQDWCDRLLKAPIEKYLPKGYSNPQISLIEMTPAERTGEMRCKISAVLRGPAGFNAIRYGIYESAAAAKRGLNSLSKTLPPDITVIYDDLSYNHGTVSSPGRDSPCMVYTAGDRTQTFITCADQIEGEPVVVSGVSSQPNAGNSFQDDTTARAGRLLEAGVVSLEAQAGQDRDEVSKKVFGKDGKK
jgi:hypothetical protein